MRFKLHSEYQPRGDQPAAIETLVRGLNDGAKDQVLLGITGSGKTFTIASVIQRAQRSSGSRKPRAKNASRCWNGSSRSTRSA